MDNNNTLSFPHSAIYRNLIIKIDIDRIDFFIKERYILLGLSWPIERETLIGMNAAVEREGCGGGVLWSLLKLDEQRDRSSADANYSLTRNQNRWTLNHLRMFLRRRIAPVEAVYWLIKGNTNENTTRDYIMYVNRDNMQPVYAVGFKTRYHNAT